MYKIILNLPSTFLEKGIMYSTWLVVLVGMVCRRIAKKCLKLEITYCSEASKTGEGLSFVTRKANVLNSVAME